MGSRRCRNCREPFTPYREWQAYCSQQCRCVAWNERHPRRLKIPSNKPTFTVENPAAVPAIYLTVDRDKVRRALRRGLVIPGIRPVESDPVAG